MPLHDDIPTRRFAYVTYVLIGINILVFFYELSLGEVGLGRLVNQWGYVPNDVTQTITSGTFRPAVLATLVTSIFLHGSWLHIIGNMLYLHIFGNNVEDSMGHFRFAVFYLLIGALANFGQILVSPYSTVPGIGASGAIAGVLGAYLLLYPRARVLMLVPIVIFFPVFYLPAFIVLIFWFVLQLFQGTAVLAAGTVESAGVGFWVHIAGFVLGMALISIFRNRRLTEDKPTWLNR